MPYIDASFLRGAPYNLDAAAYPDALVDAQILVWQEAIERATRQWFEPRAATVEVDGTDSDTLHFSVPIISVTELYINNSVDALDTSYYRVYNNRTAFPDDRRNPRIKLVRREDYTDIYSAPLIDGRLKFHKGRQNQTVVGTFGFTESDDSAPALIQRALALLVIEKLLTPIIAPSGGSPVPPAIPSGLIVEETTDDHKVKFATTANYRARPGGLAGLTNNPEVLRILSLYKSPIGMATPANWTYGM